MESENKIWNDGIRIIKGQLKFTWGILNAPIRYPSMAPEN